MKLLMFEKVLETFNNMKSISIKMNKKALSPLIAIAIVIAIIAGVLIAFNYTKYVDFSKFKPSSNEENPTITPTETKCAGTTKEMASKCCTETNGEIKATTSAVYVSNKCKCPTDTTFLREAPEGPYLICECNPC